MKKRVLCFVLCLLLFCWAGSAAHADNRDLTVYYAVGSKSAYRYHARPDCPGLSRSTVGEITLEEAVLRGLSPCTRCDPPAADFEVEVTPKPVPEKSYSSSSRSPAPETESIRLNPPEATAPSTSRQRVQSKRSLQPGEIVSIIGLSIIPAFFVYGLVANALDKIKEKLKKHGKS